MAILKACARMLCEEHAREPLRGSILTLGRALVFVTETELRDLARELGIELRDVEVELSHDPQLARLGCLDDRSFFRLLGFSEVKSLDVSDYEGADILADLNEPLAAQWHERFDVVIDIGTLHHVFDVPEALHNVHRALRVGGRAIVGMAASNNHVDHGFYMFSPTLFHDYFEANRYEIQTARLLEFIHSWFAGRLLTARWRIYDYQPGCLDGVSYGGFGSSQVTLFFIACKDDVSTGHVTPQQGYFRNVWTRPAEALHHGSGDTGLLLRLSNRIQFWLARIASDNPRFESLLVETKRWLLRLRGSSRPKPSSRA